MLLRLPVLRHHESIGDARARLCHLEARPAFTQRRPRGCVSSLGVYWPELEPVLEATYRLLSERDSIAPEDVIAEMGEGTDADHVKRGLARLYRDDYIGGFKTSNSPVPKTIRSSEKGLQEVAGWPKPGAAGGDQLEILLRLLDDQIAAPEMPPEERTRLQRVRDSLVDAGRDLIVGVLSNFIAKQTGASG